VSFFGGRCCRHFGAEELVAVIEQRLAAADGPPRRADCDDARALATIGQKACICRDIACGDTDLARPTPCSLMAEL
jgi:hypothetical protein